MPSISPACLAKLLTLFIFSIAALPAQIIIFPPPEPIPPQPWPPNRPPREIPVRRSAELREIDVDARIRDQVAEVRLSQTFHNPNDAPIEAQYLFPVPEGSAIQDFVLMVDGQEIAGELMDADKAREIYDSIVRRRRDPGLLEWAGRGLLRTSVFPIPGRGERTVTLRYTMLLPREDGRIECRLPLAAPGHDAQPAGRLAVQARMESTAPIKTIYSPTPNVAIDRREGSDGDHALRARLDERNAVPPAELRLIVGLADGLVGATLLTTRPSADEDGFFLLLAGPSVESGDDKPLPKTVIFVLDRSGSMQGKKIEQARGALRFVLDNLRTDDTFNIVAYDDRVESFRPELQRYDDAMRAEATRFVDDIRAGGSTNIDEALRTALAMLPDDQSRPAYVIFLTDGLPTAGETGEQAIAGRARAANRANGRAAGRIFSFGVGYDVNARLLDRLSGGNGGTSEFVKPDEDIEAAVSRFYGKMTSPVLSDLQVDLRGVVENQLSPRDLPDLFRGGQVILTGRYQKSGPATLRLTGRVGERKQSFDFPVDLAEPGRGANNAFVERLWAARRIGDLIDEIDLKGRNAELTDELVALSKRYGILTPYTSFLAREDTELARPVALRQQASVQLEALAADSGEAAVAQRDYKRRLRLSTAAPSVADAASMPALSSALPAGGRAGATGSGGASYAPAPQSGSRSGPSTADEAARTIRQIGAKTFYLREGAWIDAQALDRPDAQPIRIEAYSDAWFDLSRTLGPARAAWLAFDEPVTLLFDGKLYYIQSSPTESQ